MIPMGAPDPASTLERALKATEELIRTACTNPAWEEEQGRSRTCSGYFQLSWPHRALAQPLLRGADSGL